MEHKTPPEIGEKKAEYTTRQGKENRGQAF
jgi:hypothetical protein